MLQKKEKQNSKIKEKQQKYIRKKFNKKEHQNMECKGNKTGRKEKNGKN